HMMISTVKGQFQDFSVAVDSESSELEHAKIDATIQVDSINTKNEQRDQHLKSEDFFNATAFPTIQFQSTAVQVDRNGEYKVLGNLTVKDITKPITLHVEFGGLAKDPWGNQKAGYTVTGKINRSDFGLTWNAALETGGVMVSEEVKFQADLQFIVS